MSLIFVKPLWVSAWVLAVSLDGSLSFTSLETLPLLLASFSKIWVDTYTSYAIWSAVHVLDKILYVDGNAFNPLKVYNGFLELSCTSRDQTVALICHPLYRPEMFHT